MSKSAHDDTLRLDADLLAAFDEAPSTIKVPADMSERLKSRLLNRIAASSPLQVALPADAGTWRPFGAGVEIKVLHKHEALMSYLLRMAPGSELPNHRHPHDEECVVVEGRVQIGDVTMGPGSYLMERAGTLHPPIRTVQGATIFLRGARPMVDQLV